jgi:hypothetical protein
MNVWNSYGKDSYIKPLQEKERKTIEPSTDKVAATGVTIIGEHRNDELVIRLLLILCLPVRWHRFCH